MAEKINIIDEKELLVLCAFAGMDSFDGYQLPPKTEVSRQELILAVFRLYERKLLNSDDNGNFQLSEEMEILFGIVRDAEQKLQINSNSGDITQLFLYLRSGEAVCSEPSGRYYRLYLISEKELENLVFGGAFMPIAPDTVPSLAPDLKIIREQLVTFPADIEGWIKKPNVILAVEVWGRKEPEYRILMRTAEGRIILFTDAANCSVLWDSVKNRKYILAGYPGTIISTNATAPVNIEPDAKTEVTE